MGAFACGSPTQPDAVHDSTTVSRSGPFDGAESARFELSAAEDTGTASADEEADAVDGDQIDLDALGIRTATAPGSKKLSGVVRDKLYKAWTLSGVKVKAGTAATTTNAKGQFTLSSKPTTAAFTASGYSELKKALKSGIVNDVFMVPKAPAGMNVRCVKSRMWMSVKTEAGACSGRGGVAYWIRKPGPGAGTGPTVPPITPQPTKVVAKFTPPSQCEVREEAGGNPLVAKCTFNASASEAPAGSTYKWTLPGGNVFPGMIVSNPGLTCGSLDNRVYDVPVTLTVTSPTGDTDFIKLDVTFKKSGLC
jgi:hypothetical protein